MSDNLCGPSNAGKSLVTHAERDRTLHQDRFTNRQAGRGIADVGTSFHGQAQDAFIAAAEANYQEFVNAQVAMSTPTPMYRSTNEPLRGTEALPPTPPSLGRAMAPGGFVQGHTQAQYPVTYNFPNGPSLERRVALQAADATRTADASWVREFTNGQTGGNNAVRSTGMPSMSMGPGMMTRPSFGPMSMGPLAGNVNPAMFAQPMNITQQAPAVTNGITQSDDAQFSKAFDDFASARFEDDVAETSAPHEVSDVARARDPVSEASDFQAEMDKWMAEHHPRNETKDYYMDEMTSTMQSIALEQEVREGLAEESTNATDNIPQVQHDQELKRAAASILDSVADNTSQKFQQSSFLALMKRIADEEIILNGEDLVEAATGATYKVTVEPAEEGASAQ